MPALHKKKNPRSLSLPPVLAETVPCTSEPPESSPTAAVLMIPEDARRPLARSFTDDWHSSAPLHWGLPNSLLGYNSTTKMVNDRQVEQQRRNLRLMRSFAAVNEAVAALQGLLTMETAAVLVQTPDRAWVGGRVFSLRNYVSRVLESFFF